MELIELNFLYLLKKTADGRPKYTITRLPSSDFNFRNEIRSGKILFQRHLLQLIDAKTHSQGIVDL